VSSPTTLSKKDVKEEGEKKGKKKETRKEGRACWASPLRIFFKRREPEKGEGRKGEKREKGGKADPPPFLTMRVIGKREEKKEEGKERKLLSTSLLNSAEGKEKFRRRRGKERRGSGRSFAFTLPHFVTNIRGKREGGKRGGEKEKKKKKRKRGGKDLALAVPPKSTVL